MPTAPQSWERRELNQEIEHAFIRAAQAASNIETKMSHGKGAIFGDSQDFYREFSYLTRLTMSLKELESKDEKSDLSKLKLEITNWKKRKVPQNANDEVIANFLLKGLELFDAYYNTLMHYGVIALPTKRG